MAKKVNLKTNKSDKKTDARAIRVKGKAGREVKQFFIVFLCALPFIIVIAYFTNKYVNGAILRIIIYCLSILAAWAVWLYIRNKLEKRAERIRKMRREQEKKVERAIAKQKREERSGAEDIVISTKGTAIQKKRRKKSNRPNIILASDIDVSKDNIIGNSEAENINASDEAEINSTNEEVKEQG